MGDLEDCHNHHFPVGSDVEVSVDEEGFRGALFPATLLRLSVTFSASKKKAWVEYKTLVAVPNGSRKLKERVDIACLRPLPPDTADAEIEEGDTVDADDRDAWWTGVVEKLLEDGRYSVFFPSPPHVIAFERNKVRLHQDWVDGQWVRRPKMKTLEHIARSCELEKQGKQPVDSSTGNELGQSTETQVIDKQKKDDCSALEKTPKGAGTKKESKMEDPFASKNKWMENFSVQNSLQLLSEAAQIHKLAGSVDNDSKDQTELNGMEPVQQQASGNSQKRKRGRPRKLSMPSPKATGDENQDGNGVNEDRVVLKGCINDFQVVHRSGTDVSQSEMKGVENSKVASNVDEDHQPLLMLFGEMQCFASINASRRAPEKTAKKPKIKGSEQENGVREIVLFGNQEWPFVKKSPVWKAIDSLEVFSLMPQTPHFGPLATYKEECREGLAIGHMVTFASLVEKIPRLQFDDPRHVFENTLESLFDLEQHGFDITVLCNRVNELLSLRDRQVQYLDEIKAAESKIVEYDEEKKMHAEETEAIEKNIAELQKRLERIKVEMEKKDQDIANLQSSIEAIRECNKCSKLDFEKHADLPFKQD